jgi:hypothetical protein
MSNLDLKELQYRMQQEDEEGYEERHVQPHDEESHWTPPAEGDDNFKVPGQQQKAPSNCTAESSAAAPATGALHPHDASSRTSKPQ